MMHVLNTEKYAIYTQSNFRICNINYDEKPLLKFIIAGSYIILSLLSGFFEDNCLCTKKEKLFQEFHSINMIPKKMSVKFGISLWKDKWGEWGEGIYISSILRLPKSWKTCGRISTC